MLKLDGPTTTMRKTALTECQPHARHLEDPMGPSSPWTIVLGTNCTGCDESHAEESGMELDDDGAQRTRSPVYRTYAQLTRRIPFRCPVGSVPSSTQKDHDCGLRDTRGRHNSEKYTEITPITAVLCWRWCVRSVFRHCFRHHVPSCFANRGRNLWVWELSSLISRLQFCTVFWKREDVKSEELIQFRLYLSQAERMRRSNGET